MAALLLISSIAASAQTPVQFLPESFRRDVEFLCDSICEGRQTGSRGASEATMWLAREMRDAGLRPIYKGGYVQTFIDGSRVGRNVIGFIPGRLRISSRENYIIIAAHVDNIGILSGNYYPGADSNASGVAMMLALARRFAVLRDKGWTFTKNIIFVALDAKSPSYGGSENLCLALKDKILTDPRDGRQIGLGNISAFINLDIIGSSLSPLKSGRKDFLIMLGGSPNDRTAMTKANANASTGLEIAYDYYGSKDFTEMFYRKVGDQKVFLQNGVRCLLFTSGITMSTNKLTDTPESLDYPVMTRRAMLLQRWLESVLSMP